MFKYRADFGKEPYLIMSKPLEIKIRKDKKNSSHLNYELMIEGVDFTFARSKGIRKFSLFMIVYRLLI